MVYLAKKKFTLFTEKGFIMSFKLWKECRTKNSVIQVLSGLSNDTTTLENSLVVSYDIMHTVSYDPVIPLLRFYLREMSTYICKQRGTIIFIVPLFIINSNWKQPNFHQCEEKIIVCLYHGMLVSNLKEWTTATHNKMGECQKHCVKLKKKKLNTKGYVLYFSTYMTFNRQN